MKKTVLYDEHMALGARMGDFADWDMPIRYPEGSISEHDWCRSKAAVFDICHMGEFKVYGDGAAEAMDKIFPRSVLKQKVGTCRYNFLVNETGGVIDDLMIYRIAENDFFIVVNAGTREGDAKWIAGHLPENVTFEDVSDQTAKIDLQGPKCFDVLNDLGGIGTDYPAYFSWCNGTVCGVDAFISRTGYTGELGVEIYVDVKDALTVWRALLEHDDVKAGGLGARDLLRLEMGYALYGHELDTETTPVEAGYRAMLSLKNRDCIAKEALLKEPARKLVGIVLDGRRAARQGMKIFSKDKSEIGLITSGAFSPDLKVAVAMGYISSDSSDREFLIGDLQRPLAGKLTDLPFYKDGSVRSI